jgi:hypothetical protein
MDTCTYKTCKTCKQKKPDSEFIKADGKHRATRNRCKICHKAQSDIRRKLRKQNPPPEPGECLITDNPLQVDLDMIFRGYICTSCNSGIGLLHDDPESLQRAINYLKKTKPKKSFVFKIINYLRKDND